MSRVKEALAEADYRSKAKMPVAFQRGMLITALKLIREDRCERSTAGGYRCITDVSRTPDCEFTDGRWCNSCIAEMALEHAGEA